MLKGTYECIAHKASSTGLKFRFGPPLIEYRYRKFPACHRLPLCLRLCTYVVSFKSTLSPFSIRSTWNFFPFIHSFKGLLRILLSDNILASHPTCTVTIRYSHSQPCLPIHPSIHFHDHHNNLVTDYASTSIPSQSNTPIESKNKYNAFISQPWPSSQSHVTFSRWTETMIMARSHC